MTQVLINFEKLGNCWDINCPLNGVMKLMNEFMGFCQLEFYKVLEFIFVRILN